MGAIEKRDFGWALHQLKQGNRVTRIGWNGTGMFLFLVPGSTFTVNRPPLLGIYPEGTEINYHAHIDMKTAQGYVVPWLASQADMLAEDWALVVTASEPVNTDIESAISAQEYREPVLDLSEDDIIEPVEIGGHDIDVDGPPSFD